MNVDWDSWLKLLSVKGHIYVEIFAHDHRYYFFKLERNAAITNGADLLKMIADYYPQAKPSSSPTRGINPTLVLKESDLFIFRRSAS
ncbi:hypothetical protein AZI86_11415 [Bdellovibrio bacteriovorus]|uniref:Uncharacterized protein n=1 Tax=Bdellovibrio bacteriovorus TaxID=959 RepID=A0A150WLM3_BDEBC|nr:hypothetical protein [Bdellovibrio bacteriovorus]KYG64806.1 hypothetical protein AZI86_11415 [Bdellovibrio bacteriovorus]